jgi:hypothetical protein
MAEERYDMLIGIIIISYCIGVFLLVRFLQSIHHWDEEIEAIENQARYTNRKKVVHYRLASKWSLR